MNVRRLVRMDLVLLALVVCCSIEASAEPLTITNIKVDVSSLSDLTVFSGENQQGSPTVILASGLDTDDKPFINGQTIEFGPRTQPPLPVDWKSFTVSFDKDQTTVKSTVRDLRFAAFTPTGSGDPLFIGVLNGGVAEIEPGEVVNVLNGFSPDIENYFFSQTNFQFDPNGEPLLPTATPYTGQATAVGIIEVRAVPQPPSWFLYGIGIGGFAAYKWRKALPTG